MIDANDRLRIIVLGFVVRGPLGGMVWSNLEFLKGLRLLGHDVYFFEDSDDYASCYDPARQVTDANPAYGLEFAQRIFDRIGMGDRWAYYDAHTDNWSGLCHETRDKICETADLVLNLCGVNPLRPWLMSIPHRVLIDEDPAFTQIRHLTDSRSLEAARRHTDFFSFGENIARGTSRVPADDLPWQATRQPVVLKDLPPLTDVSNQKLTCVLQWQSYAARKYDGVTYGLKADAFEPFFNLPTQTTERLELALAGANAPRERLIRHGWLLRDPFEVTKDPWTYQEYLRCSKAEFGIAKHGYVASRSGWFSERSVTYMTQGRPVIVQETGFSEWLDTSAGGVLPFETPVEALTGIEEVDRHYKHHCKQAREIVAEYFDARQVLPSLLERIFIQSQPRRETLDR